ncbi:MBL fold metallo-hydrolase [Inhella sp.]|uniref:MBL fold metallo-hydrolase n=1 Tax=Inhella sp. TaxID=1921806 RepID=UPI0035B47922
MANAQEAALDFPFGDTLPEPGRTVEILPGLLWLRMRLPFALDHINLWLLRDDDPAQGPGWAIVDCGIADEATRSAWLQVLEQAPLAGTPVRRVIVTHFHPDHMGNAAWLCERLGARLWMSATDYQVARLASGSTVGMGGSAAADFFASHGLVDEEAQVKIRARASYYPSMVPAVPMAYRRLLDGEWLQIGAGRWQARAGQGHSPEHLCFSAPAQGLLIAGDMVLPRISTNVSVVDVEPEADPLKLYLDSLARLADLPDSTLVLPAHGRPFRGLQRRIGQLQEHHRERLADLRAALAQGPHSAAEVLPVLFPRKLDLHQTTFAMGEAIAHLNHLWLQGEARRTLGADGIWRFSAL